MIKNIIMPQGSQDLVPARVVRWAVAEGSPVKKGELVCEVETEKAVFEINSPMDGYLRKIITKEGEEADVFATIAYVGELSDPLPGEAAEAAPAVVSAAAPVPEASAPVAPGGAPSGRVRITPKAKHMAKDLQVDYAGLKGSGPQGRIVAADILAAQAGAAAVKAAAPAPVAAPAPAPAPAAATPAAAFVPPSVRVDTSLPGKTVTLTKIRKVIAQRMQMSKQYAPHFYVSVSADMTDALEVPRDVQQAPRSGEGRHAHAQRHGGARLRPGTQGVPRSQQLGGGREHADDVGRYQHRHRCGAG